MLYLYATDSLMLLLYFCGKVPTSLSFLCSPPGGLSFIDHVVGNQPDDEMVPVSDW